MKHSPALLFATLPALVIALPAFSQEPIDPLRQPEAEEGSYTYTIGIDYFPSGNQSGAVGPQGSVVNFTRFTQNLSFFFSGGYSFNKRWGFSGFAQPNFFIDQQKRESANRSETRSRTESDLSVGMSVDYRIAPGSFFNPRVSVGYTYPDTLRLTSSTRIIDDPVVLRGLLGYSNSLDDSGDELELGFGASFIANRNITFSGTARYRVPLGEIQVPTTTLSLRTGYRIGPDKKQDVSLRTILRIRGDETRLGLRVEYGFREGFEIAQPEEDNESKENTNSQNEKTSKNQVIKTSNTNEAQSESDISNQIKKLSQQLQKKKVRLQQMQTEISNLEQKIESLRQQYRKNSNR